MNLISEKYEILNELGHGAHAIVYLARHKKLDVLRAIKYIKKSEADSKRYLQEANLIKNLKHNGIPIIYDIEEDELSIYIIEEYISGKSMNIFMLENQKLPIDIICQFGIQICDILEYLHSYEKNCQKNNGILHLDLKPENIMVDDDNVIKIIDYDNSSYEDQELTQCIGSKGFAAPEQYHRLYLGKTADIYSLGILLLYISTFGYEQSYVEKIRHINLKKIITKCTKHNANQRYNQVCKVKLDLQNILNELSKENYKDNAKKRYNEKTKESLEINILGTKHGIGTTHICLSLTKYLSSIGIKSLCMDCTTTNDMLHIVKLGKITTVGTYQLYGTYLQPNYNHHIKVNLEEEYEIIVRDLGMMGDFDCESLQLDANKVLVLVSGGKYYEQKGLNKALDLFEDCVCILNHISGNQYYSFIQNNSPKQKIYRMPCKYNWYSSEEISNNMFSDLLNDLFPLSFNNLYVKNNNLIRRCISDIFKNKKE